MINEKKKKDNKEKKFYTAKVDRVFKTIFCDEDNTLLMKEFLSRVLGKDVQEVKYLRNELEVRNTEEQVKTVDVLAFVDDEYIHVELNSKSDPYIHVRNFNYFTSIYNKKTKRGEEIDIKSQFIHIDFTYHLGSQYDIKEEYQVISLSKDHFYLPNFKIIEYNMDKITSLWYHKDEEQVKDMIEEYKHLIMLDLPLVELKRIAKGDGFMEAFQEKLTHLNEDETFQSWMSAEEDRIVVFNTEKRIAYEDGMEKGIEQGIEQGEEKQKEEIAKNMLKKGMEISLIQELTGLSLEQISTLKAE